MEAAIRRKTLELIETMRKSETYKRYKDSCRALDAYPGLSDKIMELRQRTMDLYREVESEEMMEQSEALASEYEELQRSPEVNAFLESEEELLRLLQNISSDVLEAIDIRTPRTGEEDE